MATITLKGNTIHTLGNLPEVGASASDFKLVNGDLSEVSLADFKGKRLVLNVFPSIDTGTCATSVKTFNKSASGISNTAVLCISRDLPFALGRFCGAEGLNDVVALSDFRDGNFGKNYGLEITDGPLQGLLSRAVLVLNEEGVVIYKEQVSEIVDEPDYSAALKSLL